MFRRRDNELEVLLAHPGGPFFARKDDGVWTIPKGEATPGEDLLTRAQIEFEEEVGFRPENVQRWYWVRRRVLRFATAATEPKLIYFCTVPVRQKHAAPHRLRIGWHS